MSTSSIINKNKVNQLCYAYVFGNCNMGVWCKYEHDHSLKAAETKKRVDASRANLQVNYDKAVINENVSNTTNKGVSNKKVSNITNKSVSNKNVSNITNKGVSNKSVSNITNKGVAGKSVSNVAVTNTLCKNYIEGHCKNWKCALIHDEPLRRRLMDQVRIRIYDALKALEQSPANVSKLCFPYSSGINCQSHATGAKCVFEHNIDIRRLVVKSLAGKTISSIIIAEADLKDGRLPVAKMQSTTSKVKTTTPKVLKITPAKGAKVFTPVKTLNVAQPIKRSSKIIAPITTSKVELLTNSVHAKVIVQLPPTPPATRPSSPVMSHAKPVNHKHASQNSMDSSYTEKTLESSFAWTKPIYDFCHPPTPPRENSAPPSQQSSPRKKGPSPRRQPLSPVLESPVMEHGSDTKQGADPVAAKTADLVAPLGYYIDELGKIVKNWEEPHWLGWALGNLNRMHTSVEKAKLIGTCIPALEAGIRPPVDLIRRREGCAPEDAMFTLFPKLPFDLRAMIWKEAAQSHKNEVKIKFRYKEEFGQITDVKMINTNANPPLLLVNSESRKIAQKCYRKTLGTKWHRGTTLFNYDRDRVFFQTKNAREFMAVARFIDKKDARRIRCIVLPFRDFLKGDEIAIGWCIATRFPKLKSLRVVLGRGEQDSRVLDKYDLTNHMRGLTKLMRNSWYRFDPKRKTKPPVVKYDICTEVQAHFWGIDGLAW